MFMTFGLLELRNLIKIIFLSESWLDFKRFHIMYHAFGFQLSSGFPDITWIQSWASIFLSEPSLPPIGGNEGSDKKLEAHLQSTDNIPMFPRTGSTWLTQEQVPAWSALRAGFVLVQELSTRQTALRDSTAPRWAIKVVNLSNQWSHYFISRTKNCILLLYWWTAKLWELF